ncbi:polyprotein [Valsa ceratosperma hypovirus 1]|uniref:Polyprotein n=1 Tax=Valsa ceratosperma hypovirus 1 TaxID=1129873 RepID=I0IUP5_9VIRU|nr:unnamed protein product [Valsa ceratosperma hypovirus 1]BAM08994.1 polyprotein [Valsa ceratosperma hypovirus 1]
MSGVPANGSLGATRSQGNRPERLQKQKSSGELRKPPQQHAKMPDGSVALIQIGGGVQSRPATSDGKTSASQSTKGSVAPAAIQGFQPGQCYLILFKHEKRQDVYSQLGKYPTWEKIRDVAADHMTWVNHRTVGVTAAFSDTGGAGFKPTLFHVKAEGTITVKTLIQSTAYGKCQVGGSNLLLPERNLVPDFDSWAWIGDAKLSLDLRATCVADGGERNGSWVISMSNNAFLRTYLCDAGYKADIVSKGCSDHYCGQAFEYFYSRDPVFCANFRTKFSILDGCAFAAGAPLPKIRASEPQCWQPLFKGPIRGNHPYSVQKWVTKAQLMQMTKDNDLSGETFAVEKDGDYWHVVPGPISPLELIMSMTNKAKLGGRLDIREVSACELFEASCEVQGPLCWQSVFSMFDSAGLVGDKMTVETLVECLDLNRIYPSFTYVEWYPGDICHVQRATWSRETDNQWLASELSEFLGNSIINERRANGGESALAEKLVELTTAVVMGTIGDVEPTLDVVATNYFAATMERHAEPTPVEQQYRFRKGEGNGWMSSDFFGFCDGFAKHLFDVHGSDKGDLEVSPELWNKICAAWAGTPVLVNPEETNLLYSKSVVVELSDDLDSWLKVPSRPVGQHRRVMPDDFVLVTHPDHCDRFASEGWETVKLPMDSKEFIALGQAILEKGVRGVADMRAMHETLFEHIKAAMPTCEQSDLIYLVSGTTYHYFMASVFPEKQIFEVCPVPREDNGICPEFYLGHYFKSLSLDPHFGHSVGRLYNQWLTAPKYLDNLEWEGEFRYREPPKYHSIAPWAADKWKISSPSIGFKPYDDFIHKHSFVEKERISAYFSLGSCESLTPETVHALNWLKSLPVDWEVDSRWTYLFEGSQYTVSPFTNHATYLHKFDWVVHHGGSGVTNTCLAVGVPQSILPQIGDQYIWEDALEKHLIKIGIGEATLRAYLFKDRLPAVATDQWDNRVLSGPSWWMEALSDNGVTPVKPFELHNHCCHDWDAYGWKPTDLVIGCNYGYWITLFNSGWEAGESKVELKFVNMLCSPTGPLVIGSSGFTLTQTYPEHAHGWLHSCETHQEPTHLKAFSGLWLDGDEDKMREIASMALTSRSKSNPRIKMTPRNIQCSCGGKGYDFGGVCERCALKQPLEDVLDISQISKYKNTVYKGFKTKNKPCKMHMTFRKEPATTWVSSRKRYYQVDSRVIKHMKSPQLARALLDQIQDMTDTGNVEAFWKYTNSKPPHYEFKTPTPVLEELISVQAALHVDVGVGPLGKEIVMALGNVLSIGSFKSLYNRLATNYLSATSRDFVKKRWHVMMDGLRHYDDFTRSLGIQVIPDVIKGYFKPLERATVVSVIPYSFALAKPLRTRVGCKLWLDHMHGERASIRVHLFSIKLPVLGKAFGIFHAVVEHDGWFWELQQVSGEKCHINRTRYPPEASPDRPLIKTILVQDDIKGSLDLRRIENAFSGLDYKVLGDNCLVFSNMLVFFLTGKVIDWRHFGAFGQELSLDIQKQMLKWASSWFFLADDEQRLQVRDHNSAGLVKHKHVVTSMRSWTGPKKFTRDYGLKCVQRIEAALEAYSDDPDIDCPQERDHMIDFMKFSMSRFGISGAVISRAIMTRRTRRIPTSGRKWKFLNHLLVLFRQLGTTRIGEDFVGVLTATASLNGSLRKGRKVGWTPIINISVPRHWFRQGDKLVEIQHLPENLKMQNKKIVRLDLPQIAARYKHYFEGVEFPPVGFKWVKPGEYEIDVKVPVRKDLPKMDQLTHDLCKELQEMYPFELGVFSLRFGTAQMAEKVTDRYFTDGFGAGTLIPEADQEELAQAIFENEPHLFKDTQLISPEETSKKWHKNYSAGFPFRFNSRGNAQRQKLIDAVGGQKAFIAAVRRYIESPEAFPTVSHAFIKDEVLPMSYVEREKIRTIIAQDPLNYYLSMAVQGDAAKRLDPNSFSAVGVSASHGEMSALAEKHLAYKHHFAMDVTAMDSTASVDAMGVIKKLRKKGFQDHPQREAIETAIDATYDNLMASWIIDIHTGRARFKRKGFSTGHATTTPTNTEYMRVLALYAWKKTTGRDYKDFYECVKFSSFSDDNFWSTSLAKSIFSGKHIADFWLSRGVQVRVESESDDLSKLSFLAKMFSFDEKHLAEIESLTGVKAKVAIVHDINRLLTKFSDYKKKNTLRYRWEKMAALQLNCAHYPDAHAKVDEYLDALEKLLLKRKSGQKFIKQHPRMSYNDVMRMSYVPTSKTRTNLLVSTTEESLVDKLRSWWDTTRVDIMTFDSTVNTYGRILSQFAGLLEVGGLNVEDPGVFLRQPGEIPHDPEFTLEHHIYLLNGCPESYEKMEILAQKTPFSSFMDIAKFWSRREYYDMSEATANALRVKVTLLLAIYTLVAWLEQALMSVPILGPLYKTLATAKYLSEKVYSRLNSLYYSVFGDSSAIISSMMPKDRFHTLKVVAYKLWVNTTCLDCFDFDGGIDGAQDWADSLIKFAQDIHQIVLDFDISALLPKPGTGERGKQGTDTGWTGIDHSDSVYSCVSLMEENKVPMITGPPGAGKSTDFIQSLHSKYDTVIVACPRQILVRNNPVAQSRLFAGCEDNLTQGYINFGTAGYLRRILADLPENTIIVLDEFHEMDEDTLWLLDRYREHCIVVTATPEFYGSNRFVEVRLSKGRNSHWTVMDDLRSGKGNLEEAWNELITHTNDDKKILMIVPTVKDVKTTLHHIEQLVPGKRACGLYRGNTMVRPADWYVATSVVDAGLTIPDVSIVIDTGWSLGFKGGKFQRRPSSRNISVQRRGRTGRTTNGTYVRLISSYDDGNWDFSTPFLCNSWSTARKWDPSFKRGRQKQSGFMDSLPGGYEPFLGDGDWSCLLYAVFMYEARLDVNKARTAYQSMRKFPQAKEFRHLTARVENYAFDDLFFVEEKLRNFKLNGEPGNFWEWDLKASKQIDFLEDIPRHLLDE